MDSKELDKIIAEFEEKVLTNIDYHFNAFVYEDYKDIIGREPMYITDDSDKYLYWFYLAKDILKLMEEEWDQGHSDDSLIKLTSLKNEIDRNLIAIKPKEQVEKDLGLVSEFPELELQNSKKSELRVLINVDDKTEEAAKEVLKYLKNYGYISNKVDNKLIKSISDYNVPMIKIEWMRDSKQLAGMLKYMAQDGLIQTNNQSKVYKIILNNFTVSKLKKLTAHSIRNTVSEIDTRTIKAQRKMAEPDQKIRFILEIEDIIRKYQL